MTVVCVDNHPIMLKALMQNVQNILPEASTHSFGCVEDAFSFVKDNGCDVLISEIELAGIDGLTLAKNMKKFNSKVNIIFLTVCDEKEHAKEVMKIKPSGYLVKPAKKEQLAFELSNLRYGTYV